MSMLSRIGAIGALIGVTSALDAVTLSDINAQTHIIRARGTKNITLTHFHTLHDCRHAYAVVRLTGQDGPSRADLQAIADQLGHADLQMISRVYARHRSAAQQAVERAVAKMLHLARQSPRLSQKSRLPDTA